MYVHAQGCYTCTFDYQSDRHCSKTSVLVTAATTGLITSQIDTAPKQPDVLELHRHV